MPDVREELRGIIANVLSAAIRAVDPAMAVRAHVAREDDTVRVGPRAFRLSDIDRIIVVGGGKAGMPMAAALHELLGPCISAGVVNVKYGHTSVDRWQVRFEHRPRYRARLPRYSDAAQMRRVRPRPVRSASSRRATPCPTRPDWPAPPRLRPSSAA